MKQTNNAIKFLMAQYRAIFKHAYIKGLVSAAVLTAGLVSSATANAGELTTFSGAATGEDVTLTVSGDTTANQLTISVTDTAENKTLKGTLEILGGSDTDNTITAGAADAKINYSDQADYNGTITIANGAGLGFLASGEATGALTAYFKEISSSGTISLKSTTNGAVTLDVKTISLNGSGSVLNLTGDVKGTSVTAETWNLSGGTINLKGVDGDNSAKISGQIADGSTGKINVTGENDVIDVYTAESKTATLDIDVASTASGSIVFDSEADDATQTLSLVDSTFNVSGELTITSGSVSLSGSNSNVIVNDGATLNVTASTSAASLSSTLFELADGSTLALTGDDEAATISGQLASGSKGIIETADSTNINLYTAPDTSANIDINVAESSTATITLSGSGTNTLSLSGSEITVGGVLNIAEGNVELGSDVILSGSADSAGTEANIVKVGQKATLTLTGTTLSEFLNSATPTNKVGRLDIAASGSLTISSGTVVINSGTGIGFGNSADKTITVAAGATLDFDTLQLEGKASTVATANAISANTLTYKYDSSAASTGLTNLTVKANLKSENAKATIKDAIKLYKDSNLASGSISGTEDFTIESGGSLDIQGDWTASTGITAAVDNAIKIGSGASGALTVGDGTTLTVNTDKAVQVGDSGSLTIASGGELEINFTSDATKTFDANEVDLDSGSTLTLTSGNFVVSTDGEYSIKGITISGTSAGAIVADSTAIINSDKLGTGDITWKAQNGGTLKTDTLSGSGDKIFGSFNIADEDSTLEVGTLQITDNTAVTATNIKGTVQVNNKIVGSTAIDLGTGYTLQLGNESSTSKGTFNQNLTIGNTTNVLGSWQQTGGDLKITVDDAGKLTIGDGKAASSLTVSEIADTTTSGGINVMSGSTMTVNGVVTVEPEGSEENALADTPTEVTKGDDGHYGFALTDKTVNVQGGTFVIGSVAAGGILTNTNWDKTEVVTPEGSAASGGYDHGYVYDNFGKYSLSNGGTLSVQFSGGEFTLTQLKQMKHELINGVGTDGIITDGFLDIGAAKVGDLSGSITDGAMSWEDFQAAQTSGAAGIVNEQLAETTVTGVSGNFYGGIGAVQIADSEEELTVNGQAQLVGADANSGNFVSDSSGNLVAVNTTEGSTLTLKGTGNIGEVVFVSGSTGADTALKLAQGRNDEGTDTKANITLNGITATYQDDFGTTQIIENTFVDVAKNVDAVVKGDLTIDNLTAQGSISVSGDTTVNNFSSTEDVALTAKNLTINEFADIKGSVTVAENMEIESTKSGSTAGTIAQASVAGKVNVGKDLSATHVDFTNEVAVGQNMIANDSTFSNNVTVEKALTTSGSTFSKTVTVKESLDATDVTFASGSTVTAKSATFKGTNSISGSFVASGSVTLGVAAVDTTPASGATVEIAGEFGAKDIKFVEGASSNLNIADGSVSADTLVANSGVTITVGSDDENDATGELEVTSVKLAGATLMVDPSYEKATALFAAKELSGYDSKKNPGVLGTLDGNLFVGQNAAAGLGVDKTTLRAIIAQYQDNGHFTDPADGGKYGAMLYADKPFSIDNQYGIVLTAGTKADLVASLEDAKADANTTADSFATNYTSATTVLKNTIYFGENTALGVNTNNIKSGSAYITFVDVANSSNTDKGTLVANGGEIVLFGDNYKKSYQLFEDGVKLQDITGHFEDASITVVSANGLLEATIAAGADGTIDGNVEMNLSESGSAVFMANASTPVQTTLTAYLNGYNGNITEVVDPETGATSYEADYLYTTDANGNRLDGEYNNEFLSRIVLGGTAADAEIVARLGVYGGTHQATLVAGSSTTDAIAGRMGVGAQTGSITFADNGQGAGLWVSPIYKNHDSDGFGAQGVSYGADLDMYGVALGADYTLDSGVRLGAAFNVGSGDADGQGAGAGVSNDFDYYGFSIYGGFTSGAMSIVGDFSYTVVDNDITGNTAVEKVSASMDSTNMSFGVTGAYALDLNSFNVTPHAGLRFTQIDMDDYTVKGAGDIAKYSADSANIFSIPVGVTFSKEIVTGSWTVKPALDLTLTANMGDDSVDGTVAWTGVENLQTKVESEVIDSFTYGANLGIAAKSGNFSFGLGLNYTGASNADEYGVNANARFVF